MGISRGGARLLLAEASKRPFHGKALQLGRQHLFFGQDEMDVLARLHGFTLRRDVPSENVRKPLLADEYLDDGSFFSQLGFSTVESLDASDDEKPDYIHDLNLQASPDLLNRYDMIYDGGTMEHVFDVRAVLRNIVSMLKVGGRIIHAAPSSNHVDHGFYMFSPTLFLDYYATNGFIVHELQLVLYSQKHNSEPWSIHNYEPGCLDGHFSFGGFDQGKLLLLNVVAEKTAQSTWNLIPQQGFYAKSKRPVIARDPEGHSLNPQRRSLVDRLLRRNRPVVPNKIAEY